MTLVEQKKIIFTAFKTAIESFQVQGEIDSILTTMEEAINDANNMQDVYIATNLALAQLEKIKEAKSIIANLKKNGFYNQLYTYPKYEAKTMWYHEPLPRQLSTGFMRVFMSGLIVIAFACTLTLGAPFWFTAITTGLFVGASAYLSGIVYGVINDLLGTQANLPFYLLNHKRSQNSLLPTNDKTAQGIAWGVAATSTLAGIFGVVFAVTATIIAFIEPTAVFILPALMALMPIIAYGADIFSKHKAKHILHDCDKPWETLLGKEDINGKDFDYQINGLTLMCPTADDKAAWFAEGHRNRFGYQYMPLVGLAALVSLITLSAVNDFLPDILFSNPILGVYMPVVFAATAVLALGAGWVYMEENRDTQHPDRYQLAFHNIASYEAPGDKVNFDLYEPNQRTVTHAYNAQSGSSDRTDGSTAALNSQSSDNGLNLPNKFQ